MNPLSRIRVVEERAHVSSHDVRTWAPRGEVFVLDLLVDDAGTEQRKDWQPVHGRDGRLLGYEKRDETGVIVNLDHHADVPEFRRHVSTVHLVVEHVKAQGPTSSPILLHHTDCDSVLSALILCGALPPESRWEQAALAADHTGARDDVADLLQAIQDARDVHHSLRQLRALLEGRALEPRSHELLTQRREDRDAMSAARFTQVEGAPVWWVQLERKVDSALAVDVVADGAVVLLASPMPGTQNHAPMRWEVKVRAGMRFPPGHSLAELALPDFGGRWNAGSTKRHGGTALAPQDYAAVVADRVRARGWT